MLALLFSTLASAQYQPEQNRLNWSKSLAIKKKATFNKFVGKNEDGMFVTKTTLKQEVRGNYAFPVLEVYDESFHLKKSRDLDVKEGKGKISYENTVMLEGKLYLFYSLRYIWNQTITLMVQPLDAQTLQPAGAPYKAIETKIPTVTTRDQLTDFRFEFSDNHAFLLVSNVEPSGGNKNQKIHLFVLDGHTSQGWEKEVELPYQAKMFDMVSQSVDNDGHAYLLGAKYLEGNRDKKNGKPNYDYVLMGFTQKGTESFNHHITSKDKFFRDMRVAVTPQQEIIVTGFYSNDGASWNGLVINLVNDSYAATGAHSVGGVYYLKLSKDNKAVLTEKYNGFSLDFLTQNMKKRQANKAVKRDRKGKENQEFNFSLDDLIVREDGAVTLVGEQISNTTVRTEKPAQPHHVRGASAMYTVSSTDYYSYQDIIAVHLSAEGEPLWAEKIAKKQNTVSDFGLFSSYVAAYENGRLHFIFNEHRKNLNYKGEGDVENFNPRKDRKNAALALVTLDENGNKSKRHLAQPAGSTVFLKSSTSRQFSDKNLYLFGWHKKDFRLGRLDF